MSVTEEPIVDVRKQLDVQAVDNFGHSYPVELVLQRSAHWGWKWVLVVKGTPGRWYMTTLLDHTEGPLPNNIYVGYGQLWLITNFNLVMRAALKQI
jgi:hypothetical protein